MKSLGDKFGFDLDTPFKDFSEKQLHLLLYGTKGRKVKFKVSRYDREVEWNGMWEGIINNLERRYRETRSDWMREEIEKYMSTAACPVCNGNRLRPEVLAVTIQDKNISDVTRETVKSAAMFFETLGEKPDMIFYREKDVRKALQYGAVETLIISKDFDKKIAKELTELAENIASNIEVVSTETTEGEQFNNLSGIGAILRFKVG